MSLSTRVQQLRDQYLQILREATYPLQQTEDREVALEALLEATALLRERLEQELAELRQEEAE